jgi:glycerophosphoryl diester phosphodiesterase
MLAQLPRPVIFAHRGASAHAPENTIAAFDLALEHHADAVELDVQLTADRHLVVIHDRSVQRTTGGDGNVSSMRLEEIKGLDAGSSFNASFRGEPIPTLEEIFARYRGKMYLNVELKNETSPWNDLPDRVVQLVDRFKVGDEVLISSFNPLAILRVRRLNPDIPVAALAYRSWRGEPVRRLAGIPFRTQALHVDWRDVNEELVARAHRNNQRLHVYTVNNVIEIQKLAAMGVDGIFTDDPQLASQTLSRTIERR